MRKQYLSFSLACPWCFIEFPKDRRTQNDAPRHHARRAPKLAVLYRIHEFLQKSTKNVTKKLTKKNEKSIFWYPKVFIENYCKMSPEIKISKRILHFVKMWFWALLTQKTRKTQQQKKKSIHTKVNILYVIPKINKCFQKIIIIFLTVLDARLGILKSHPRPLASQKKQGWSQN